MVIYIRDFYPVKCMSSRVVCDSPLLPFDVQFSLPHLTVLLYATFPFYISMPCLLPRVVRVESFYAVVCGLFYSIFVSRFCSAVMRCDNIVQYRVATHPIFAGTSCFLPQFSASHRNPGWDVSFPFFSDTPCRS